MAENETGKSKNARYRVEDIGKQLTAVKERLETARKNLSKIASQYQQVMEKPDPNSESIELRTPVSNLERIELKINEVLLYIEFCIVSEDDNIVGAIVYGALRVPRYPKSFWEYKNIKEKRPLFNLSVDEYGKISAKGKLDDEWWFERGEEEDEKSLKEMHNRVLDLVWRDALNWMNEALLP
ncbi:MAG: hypothetical protein C4530_12780 [Desulfobacteraceae bacterium]|nr:MAG: hypothetical protein C4530_12780 [Desulfobacteraceae bacterium]